MLHQISLKLSEHIVVNSSSLGISEQDQIRYAIETILGEISKFVLLCLFFMSFGYLSAYLFAFISFSLLRLLAGGFHFKTYTGCLIGSMCMYSAIVFSGLSNLPVIAQAILALISIALLYIYAPVIPANRISAYAHNIKVKRIWLGLTTFILSIVSLILGVTSLFLMTLFVFSIQLVLGGLTNETIL